MNSKGQRVILLLVVGLAAFSSAMKELNQVQELTLDASRLIAQWSARIAPIEVPQTVEVQQPAAKVETCEVQQSLPSVELPWLGHEVAKPGAVVPRPSQVVDLKKTLPTPGAVQIARLKKVPQIDVDPVAFEFRAPSDQNPEADFVVTSDFPVNLVKAKTRKHNSFRISFRDRDMLLKTLNRSFNLRTAS